MEREVEFVVPLERVASLKKNQGRVENLFQVCIRMSDANLVGDEGHSSGQQWIRVLARTDRSSVEKAKEYILSLCDPQIQRELRYPPEYDNHLRRCRHEIENESTAAVTFTDRHSVLISGDDIKVTIAWSLFEQEITRAGEVKGQDCTDSAGVFHSLTLEEDPRFSPDCQSPGKDSCYSSDDSDGANLNHDFLKRDGTDQQSVYVQRTYSEQKNKSNYDYNGHLENAVATDGSPKQTSDSYIKHIDFAAKLGYSEMQVGQVLSQLGPDVDQNDLLHALVKMTKPEPEEKLIAREAHPQTLDVAEELSSDRDLEDESSNLRPIIIDGSNVAMSHGNKQVFSCRGIAIVVDWFIDHGHDNIKVFVPQWRKEASKPDTPITEQEILYQLEKDRIVVWTPSRRINGRRVVCYDDRYILKTAKDMDGIIVSNDNFRDLQNENPEWKKFIEERLLMYSFVDDTFMPPDDPLGRHGPSLENFLRKNPTAPEPQAPPCPYGKKCTYGNKCKYYHADRPQFQKSVSEKLQEQAKTRKEVRARGVVQRPNTDASNLPVAEPKKAVSPQNSGNLGERGRYAQMFRETRPPRQGMVPDGGRDPNARMTDARFDPYMEPLQSGTYPQQYSPYKANTDTVAVRRVGPPQHYPRMPHTVEMTGGYRRDMYANPPPRYDPREELVGDMRQMTLADNNSAYHGGGFAYSNGQAYPRETYRHPQLSRQPSYHQQELYSPQMPHLGIPEYQPDQTSLHPNVSRMRSYPVDGPVPAIREPRPNMTRQNSTSDPQLYHEDMYMRLGRTYQSDGDSSPWRGETAYHPRYSSGGQPPARNGSEPLLWSNPQNPAMRPSSSSSQALPRPANVGPSPASVSGAGVPFEPSDPRYNIFNNLNSIFGREDILAAMKKHPEEMDPQKICIYILNP